MPLINCTPHPVRVFPPDAPDRIADADIERLTRRILPTRDGEPARIGEIDLGTVSYVDDLPVEYVEYRHVTGLPEPVEGTFYVVPLALVMRLTYASGPEGRGDLLVPYREVRNLAGTVVGCRLLAKPV